MQRDEAMESLLKLVVRNYYYRNSPAKQDHAFGFALGGPGVGKTTLLSAARTWLIERLAPRHDETVTQGLGVFGRPDLIHNETIKVSGVHELSQEVLCVF